MQLYVILWEWYKKGDSSLARGRRFQSTIISTRGIARHNVGLLFIVYVIVGKTYYSKMLLYCTKVDYVGIGSYVHRQKQYMRKDCPVGR